MSLICTHSLSSKNHHFSLCSVFINTWNVFKWLFYLIYGEETSKIFLPEIITWIGFQLGSVATEKCEKKRLFCFFLKHSPTTSWHHASELNSFDRHWWWHLLCVYARNLSQDKQQWLGTISWVGFWRWRHNKDDEPVQTLSKLSHYPHIQYMVSSRGLSCCSDLI